MIVEKRRHHYVWRYYLDSWTVDGQIFCCRKGHTFRTGTKNVAVETDFYRLKELTKSEIAFIEQICIAPAIPTLKPIHRRWLRILTFPFHLKRQAQERGIEPTEYQEELRVAISNIEEEIHAGYERDAIPYIDALRRGDLGFLQAGDAVPEFFQYLGIQYMRTKNMQSRISRVLRDLPGMDPENVWSVARHIFGTNVGRGLFIRLDHLRISLLTAPEAAPFITGDQPVINLHAVGLPLRTQVEKLRVYYPVSPQRGLLLDADTDDAGIEERHLTADEVHRMNLSMADQSHEQVFSSHEVVVNRYCEDEAT